MGGDGLPAWTYYSKELLELEKALLFRRHWQLVGHASDLPEAGDYLCLDMVGERAVVVRGKDGQLRAFHNICRHRGSRVLVDGQGSCKAGTMVCPFHGWTYNLDGTLRGVPKPASLPALDRQEHGLVPLELEIWNGFLFVRFETSGLPSVAQLMAPFEDEVAGYRLAELQPYSGIETDELPVNWKAVRDVDNEGYHVPIAHPMLQDLYGRRYSDDAHKRGVSRSFAPFNEGEGKLWSVRHYRKVLPEVKSLPGSHRRAWLYLGLFPNTVFMLYPDVVGFYQEWPAAVGQTIQRGAYYARPDARREMRLARYLSQRIDRVTSREDQELTMWSWEAMQSTSYAGMILSDLEIGVRDYHDSLRREIPVMALPDEPASGTLADINASLLAAR
ncbi:MAG: SRPBCC family protein [Kiloniellales bacterium]